MKKILIKGATIMNEGESFIGSLLIQGDVIDRVVTGDLADEVEMEADEVIDARGLWLLPGAIDDQVHFREPGLTHKGDIHSESAAAVAGGVTSFMEMPNTNPQTTNVDALQWKYDRAAETSFANYSFYMGATNDNFEELKKIDHSRVCGIKIFMGSSTGNMLVDSSFALSRIFAEIPALIAVHCEKEEVIQANKAAYTARFGNDLPVMFHPLIRNAEACYASSSQAVELAAKYNTRLHLLHLSTACELSLLENRPLEGKRITGEVCVHHLYFDDNDYAQYGNLIKWNPAIKTCADRLALIEAVRGNQIDVVATDHAPHLLSEKQGSCFTAASGGPLLQHSLLAMIEMACRGQFTMEKVIEKMCHAPARLYNIEKRGFLRSGYYADLVLINPTQRYVVTPESILSKCGWSPFTGHTFTTAVNRTFVNGQEVYAHGEVNPAVRGKELKFSH